MVLVVVYLAKEDCGIVAGDIKQFPFHPQEYPVVKYLPPVFSRKDYVIVAFIQAVMIAPVLVVHIWSISLVRRTRVLATSTGLRPWFYEGR